VYSALIQPARWWASDHTFSHSAANLTFDAHAGGCFCEVSPTAGPSNIRSSSSRRRVSNSCYGSARAVPDIRRRWQLELGAERCGRWHGPHTDQHARGFIPEGFEEWAKRADAMMAGTVERLKRFMETGAADAHKEEPKSR